MSAVRSRTRQALVAFLARELDEEDLRASGWAPGVRRTHWYATYRGGRRDSPYRMSGPSGPFTRYRGDHPEALYRLDGSGGWMLDAATGTWRPDDAPVRLFELGELSQDEVEALFELDDWGSWYFDYEIGNWQRTDVPRFSHYLADLDLHEVDSTEARRVANALGAPDAVESEGTRPA
jgi:hypothetical protein